LKNIIFLQTYLPHFIGELKIIKHLFAADNMLAYIPHCLFQAFMTELDLINNNFYSKKPYDHLKTYKQSIKEPTDFKLLKHTVFFKLMDNFPQLKRQEIPRPLWEYFNYVGRCDKCRQWTLPDYSKITCVKFVPNIPKLNMAISLYSEGLTWQVMYCTDKINCEAYCRKHFL